MRKGEVARLLICFSCAAAMASPRIKLYTHSSCPFAQRVWIALEASGIPFEKVEVNLYGSGGFDKRALKTVEAAAGLAPKGYIPVMSIDEEVIRESSVLVERVALLSSEVEGATSLVPEHAELAERLTGLCNGLPTSPSSLELSKLMLEADATLASNTFLAGSTFSVADCCLLPFFQRVEADIPTKATHLRAYMARAHETPAFAKTVVSSWWWWW